MYLRTLILIGIALLLSACSHTAEQLKPMHMIFNHMPDGPIEYQQGWQDGCTSGLTVKTNDFYRTFYRYTLNKEMLSDAYYYRAWKSSFDYCRAYAYGMLKEANMRNSQPNDAIPNPQGILSIMNNWGPGITSRW